jgi:protein-disulfide isomerase
VIDNQAAGEKAGVTGTPAFFVDGELLAGAQPFEKFRDTIERHLHR